VSRSAEAKEWQSNPGKENPGMNAVFLIGRIVFGGFFLVNGINHFTMMRMMAAYSEAKGVPAAGPAVVVTGLLLIFGGLSVLLGFQPRLGLAALIVFLVGVTPLMHGFWQVADAQARLHRPAPSPDPLAHEPGRPARAASESNHVSGRD